MYSPEFYTLLLKSLMAREYAFVDFDHDPADEERCVFLRHDIDYSPRWAADFARLNRDCGVVGTFCFQIRSPLYNFASKQCLEAVGEIESLGQHVALHFAFVDAPALDSVKIKDMVSRDFEMARSIVPSIKPWFSWHNPSVNVGLIDTCLDMEIPGLLNLYSRAFVKNIVYRSDSNWRFSVEEWSSIFGEGHKRMQLLFHPFQWMARGRSMREVLALTYAEIARAAQSEFATNHVWKAWQTPESSEFAFSQIGGLFGAVDRAG